MQLVVDHSLVEVVSLEAKGLNIGTDRLKRLPQQRLDYFRASSSFVAPRGH